MLISLDYFIQKALVHQPKRIVIALAEDLFVLKAIQKAKDLGMISPIFIGDIKKINELSGEIGFDISGDEIIDQPDHIKACKAAVEIIKKGHADILMKGSVTTSILLKSVIDKDKGLLEGKLLSHFAFFQLSTYHKLLAITDAAMNIKPNLKKKVEIIRNSVNVLIKLGYEIPKVAIVCPVEIVNSKIESTVHAAKLTLLNKKNQLSNCIVFGPLALDNAISKEAALHKGIQSEVAGDADLLVTPNLDSGNILYKAINFLSGGKSAAIITGAIVPIVLTSRADSEESKLYSIALAACL
jgi:phosphate butyryltransferase